MPKLFVCWLLIVVGVQWIKGSTIDDVFNKSHSRHRRCCYLNESKMCPNRNSCIVNYPNQTMVSPNLKLCNVQTDSIRDKNIQELMNFSRDLQSKDIIKPPGFYLKGFVESEHNLSGIELNIDINERWSTVKFRIINTELCNPDDPQGYHLCLPQPRYVEIMKSHLLNEIREATLLYDCELAFYKKNNVLRSTVNNIYKVDVCFDYRCGSYYFIMQNHINFPIPMIEIEPLVKNHAIVAYIPKELTLNSEWIMFLYHNEYNCEEKENWEEITQRNITEYDSKLFVNDGVTMSSGCYKVVMKNHYNMEKSLLVYKFEIQLNSSESTLGTVALVLFLMICIVTLLYYSYRRYNEIKNNTQVDPIMLFKEERISGKNILIITNVDNKDHIDIVFDLIKYLKNYCAVSEVYFALDPENGIYSEKEDSAFQWAVHVTEKMGTGENNHILFITSPPQTMGSSIYKNLPNNQAMIASNYLQTMTREKRVSILNLPYSDSQTLPEMVNCYVKERPFQIPKDMDKFLRRLLSIEKRRLYPFLSCPRIYPEVMFQNFNSTADGEKLLEKINKLSEKTDEHRQALLNLNASDSNLKRLNQTTTEEQANSAFESNDSEKKNLLSPVKSDNNGTPKFSSELQIEIEPGIMSLRSEEAEERNRNIHPEFQT